MNNRNKDLKPERMLSEKAIEEQARDQTGQRQVKVHVEEQNARVAYANGFRTAATPEEVILDFGLNLVQPPAPEGSEGKVVFRVNERIILNYYSAKRLAMALGQLIRRYEQQFGELELNAAKRRSGPIE